MLLSDVGESVANVARDSNLGVENHEVRNNWIEEKAGKVRDRVRTLHFQVIRQNVLRSWPEEGCPGTDHWGTTHLVLQKEWEFQQKAHLHKQGTSWTRTKKEIVSDRQQKERRKVLRDAITKAECQDQQQLKPSRDMRNNTKGSYKHAISKSWFRQIFLFGWMGKQPSNRKYETAWGTQLMGKAHSQTPHIPASFGK